MVFLSIMENMNIDQDKLANHLKLAHHLWERLLKPGDWAIDATCGNGHDALFLSRLGVEKLFCIDLQTQAIEKTRQKVPNALFFRQCHSDFPKEALSPKLKLIVYNLGYLPGGDKNLTTQTPSTKQSIKRALEILPSGGALSITFYPGHEEGKNELEAILPILEALPSDAFTVTKHCWINRKNAPLLVFALKI